MYTLEVPTFIALCMLLVGWTQRWLVLRQRASEAGGLLRVLTIEYQREPHLTLWKWKATCKVDMGGRLGNDGFESMWWPTKGLARRNLLVKVQQRWIQRTSGKLVEKLTMRGHRVTVTTEEDEAMEVLARGETKEEDKQDTTNDPYSYASFAAISQMLNNQVLSQHQAYQAATLGGNVGGSSGGTVWPSPSQFAVGSVHDEQEDEDEDDTVAE